jgi:hypothetical protein
MNPGKYFALLSVMMLVVAAVFYFVAKRFNRLASEQEEINKHEALALAVKRGVPPGD